MPQSLMSLKVLIPFQVFADRTGVSRVVAESEVGSFGLLPHRLDCVAALVPGILIYQVGTDAQVYLAVDQGTLVKTGMEVLVSVRRAIGGTDLKQLRAAVKQEFQREDEDEKSVRRATAMLETGLLRRLAEFQHG